jgi:hypothetical protein
VTEQKVKRMGHFGKSMAQNGSFWRKYGNKNMGSLGEKK